MTLCRRLVRVAAAIPAVLALIAGFAAAQSTLNVPSITYPTIQSAVDAAGPGDTVQIAAGTFTSAAPGFSVVRVENKTDLTIQGAGTTGTIIDAQMNYGGGIFVVGSSDVTISDLTVRNMNRQGIVCFESNLVDIHDVRCQGLGATVQSASGVVFGISVLDTQDCTIDDVTLEDCSGGGVQYTGLSTGTLSDFVVIDSAGVFGYGAVIYDTLGGIDVPGGPIDVAVSGSNTIIGCPTAFLMIDTPLGAITTSFAGTTSVFGVISEVTVVGEGTINGLADYVAGMGLAYTLVNGSAAAPNSVAYFSSLANAAIAVGFAPNPMTAVIEEIGEDKLFVAPGMKVQSAVDFASPGDEICLLPGVYTTTSGSWVVRIQTDDLTLTGLDRDTVILDGLGNRSYAIYVLGASGVTISNLTVKGANFEHLTGVDADGLVIENVRVDGAGRTVQGPSGRIHGVVLNTHSTGAEVSDLIAEDLSGAGLQVSPGGEVLLRDFAFTDVAGNSGFGAISVYVSGGVSVPDGDSMLRIEGVNAIQNTMVGGTGIVLGDADGRVLTFQHDAATSFTNVFFPLLRYGGGCIPLIDDSAVGMGLPWRLTGAEPAIPDGAFYFADEPAAQAGAAVLTSPGTAVIEMVFAQPFPGSGEDFEMLTFIDGAGDGSQPLKTATAGSDLLTVSIASPCGTFFGGVPVLAVQFWDMTPPMDNAFYPFVHFEVSNAAVVFDGGAATPFGPTLLGAAPINLTYALPSVLSGFTARLQAFVISIQAANMIFAGSNAHDITFD